jgi:hypothetical protein
VGCTGVLWVIGLGHYVTLCEKTEGAIFGALSKFKKNYIHIIRCRKVLPVIQFEIMTDKQSLMTPGLCQELFTRHLDENTKF